MNLQLDTTNKTVKVEENVKVIDLINLLKKMLPNDWEHFTLQTHTEITYWRDPIIIKEPYYEPYKYPWYVNGSIDKQYMLEATKTTAEYSLKPGLYNVEA